MLQTARLVLQERTCCAVIDDIILEEKKHLRSLSKIKDSDEKLTDEENFHFAPLTENYPCNEEDSLLIQKLYNRQLAMADFYRLMSGKSKIESIRKALYSLYQDELSHSVKIRTLFPDMAAARTGQPSLR